MAEGLRPKITRLWTELRLEGAHNLLFLLVIIAAVVLSGTLPAMPAFRDPDGAVKGIRVFREVTLGWPTVIEIVMILIVNHISKKVTETSLW